MGAENQKILTELLCLIQGLTPEEQGEALRFGLEGIRRQQAALPALRAADGRVFVSLRALLRWMGSSLGDKVTLDFGGRVEA